MITYCKSSQKGLNIRAQIYVIDSVKDMILEVGSGIIRHINQKELLVSDLKLPSQSLPIKPFKIGVVIGDDYLSRIPMTCSVKRLGNENNGEFTLSLSIDRMPEKCLAIILDSLKTTSWVEEFSEPRENQKYSKVCP